MIPAAVWEIGEARLCIACQVAMAPEYVMRNMGKQLRASCERCGRQSPATFLYRYTMKGNVKKRKGLL